MRFKKKKTRHADFPKIIESWKSPWKRNSEMLHGLPCLYGKQQQMENQPLEHKFPFSFQLKYKLSSQTRMAVNTQKILKDLKSIAPVDVWIERCKILESYAPESWLVIPEQTCFGEKGNFVLPVEACGVQQRDLSIAMGYKYLSNSQRYHFPLWKHFFGPSSLRNLVESCLRRTHTLAPWGCASPKPSSLAFCGGKVDATGVIGNVDCELFPWQKNTLNLGSKYSEDAIANFWLRGQLLER